jgi:hypothetical protein
MKADEKAQGENAEYEKLQKERLDRMREAAGGCVSTVVGRKRAQR